LFLGVKWKEQDSFLRNGGQIYATSAPGSIAISVREISLALQTAICCGILNKRHCGVGYKMLSDNEEKDKKRIISALESKPLLSEELIEALGYESGGGELVFPIRELMEEGKIMREKEDTFRYSLIDETESMTGRKWVGLDEPMGDCKNCIHQDECAPLKRHVQQKHLNGNYRFRCPVLIEVGKSKKEVKKGNETKTR